MADQGHKLVYKKFKGEPLHVAVFDASWGRQTRNCSQFGFGIGVGPTSMKTQAATVHLLKWRSTPIHRKTKSMLAAEGAAGSVGFDHLQHVKVCWAEQHKLPGKWHKQVAKLPGLMVTDSCMTT